MKTVSLHTGFLLLLLLGQLFPLSAQDRSYVLARRFDSHVGAVTRLCFDPEGQLLATAGRDQRVQLWDLRHRRLRYTLAHRDRVEALAYSPDARYLLSGDNSGQLKLWDAATGQLKLVLAGHREAVYDLAIHPAGRLAASVSEDGSLRLWDLQSGEQTGLRRLEAVAYRVAWSPDGRLLAAGDEAGQLCLWDTGAKEQLACLETGHGRVLALAFSPGSRWLATAGDDRRIRLWQVEKQQLVKILSGHARSVYDLGFSPDAGALLSGSRDGSLMLWDLQSGLSRLHIPGDARVRAVAFHPSGRLFAAGDDNGQARLWYLPEEKNGEDTSPATPVQQVEVQPFVARSDVDFNLPATRNRKPQAIAVVIGNQHYRHPDVPEVEFALQDAGSVKNYLLESFGYEADRVLYLPDATQADLFGTFGSAGNHRARLYSLLQEQTAEKAEVFIYYSGHGVPGEKGASGYLLPVDGDPDLAPFQGYSLQTLYDNLGKLPYAKLTVVIDACFSGRSEGGSLLANASPVYIKVANPVFRDPRAQIFTASRASEVASWYPAQSHSLFTYYFLKGLQGAANTDGDGQVKLSELRDYLQREVPYMARKLRNRRQMPEVHGRDEAIVIQY